MSNSADFALVEPTPSSWALLRPYVIDILGPFVAYLLVHALGAPAIWAMTAAGTASALGTAINSIRKKGLDVLGLLVLIEIAGSVALSFYSGSAKFGLIRPSFYTAIAAIYLCISALVGRPLTYRGSRVMVARRGPARIAAYEKAWDNSAEFRRTHCFVTFAFGVCLAVDSVLRVIIVYHFDIDRSAWLSNIPHVTALTLMMIASALAGKRFSRLVDEQS
jgi:hypothetical protein